MKWFHAIGICGKATSSVALMFRQMGWFVTGSDLQFFPPASTILEKNNIPTVEGYNFAHLDKSFWQENFGDRNINFSEIPEHPDLCLIVESATDKNKEYLYAKKLGVDVRPFSQILGEYLVKPNSIVVIGTAGKTTTTALATSVLESLGKEPSFMIGAEVNGFDKSIANTTSEWSVLEGDEYYSKVLSRAPKFIEYKPKYLLITKISWEHIDVYPTFEEYLDAFRNCVDILPSNGLLVAKADDENIDLVSKNSKAPAIRYKYSEENIPGIYTIRKGNGKNEYQIFSPQGEVLVNGKTMLIGEYNLENICAVFALYNELGLLSDAESISKFIKAVASFEGAKKRLEKLLEVENFIVIDDFGVAPERAANTLATLKSEYPEYKIIAVFEPNAGSRPKDIENFNNIYKNAFDNANMLVVPELSDSNTELLATDEFIQRLSKIHKNLKNIPANQIAQELPKHIDKNEKTLVVFMSAYRLTSVAQEFSRLLQDI